MKLYGMRFIKSGINKSLALKSETQDAILWSVQSGSRLCSVKIQGSDKSIQAFYPENWEKTPVWLKPGNAVKIMHTGGNRGRIEIVGHGLLIPTPVDDGDENPTVATAPDTVLTGCNLSPSYGGAHMAVLVGIGTYRIDGTVYTLDAIACNSDAYYCDMGGLIGTIAGALAVPAAPAAGLCRYDAVEVGIDGVLHYLTGSASATPVDPAISADHVKCGARIVVQGGTVSIGGANIRSSYTPATPSAVSVTFNPDSLLVDGDQTSTITLQIRDQYGALIAGNYVIDAAIIDGNGTISGDGAAGQTATRTFYGSSTTFTFEMTDGDQMDHASIQFTLHTNVSITVSGAIIRYYS